MADNGPIIIIITPPRRGLQADAEQAEEAKPEFSVGCATPADYERAHELIEEAEQNGSDIVIR